MVDDTTPEKLVDLMEMQGGSITLTSAEGGLFDALSGRYDNKGGLDIFLKGHAGDPISVDRIGRKSNYIPKPRLTVMLTIQPAILYGLMDNATFKGRGLCGRFLYGPERDRELVEVWHPKDGWSRTLELSRKANGFGGSQVFFLCPACGERRRYLYLTGTTFLCRKCARLNYQSQQETRSDSMYFYDKGMALAEKHLDTWPGVRPDGFSFCDWVPDRPRYMHRNTYQRYLRRFLRYRKQHFDRQINDMARLLRGFK